MAGEEARFSVNIDGNASAFSAEASASLEKLRASTVESQEAIKGMSTALRALRGNSEEVRGAKDQLRAKIDAERASLSTANLAILKQGTNLQELNKQHKLTAQGAKGAEDAEKGLNNGLLRLLGVSRESRLAIGEFSSGIKLSELASAGLVAGALALAAAIAAVSIAAIAGVYALGKWIVETADAGRALALTRQGIAGSADDTKRMGDQIDLLRQKVPLTTDALSELYRTTRTAFDGTRVSGQAILDVVTTIAQTAGAMGDSAAAKIKEITERGKNLGRLQILPGFNSFSGGAGGKGELAGTGIDFNDVAKHLAENTGVSLAKAKTQLARGAVAYVDGIKALRQTAEKSFGETNAAKLLSLDNQAKRFHDDLKELVKGVDLTPFLKALQKIESVFSANTVSGYALKKVFEAIGKSLGLAATDGAPLLQTALRVLILETVKLTSAFLTLDIWIKRTFSKSNLDGVDKLEIAMAAGKVALYGVLAVLGLMGAALVLTLAPVILMAIGFEKAYSGAKKLYDLVNGQKVVNGGEANAARGVNVGGATTLSGGGRTAPANPTIGPPVIAPAHASGGIVARPSAGEYFASVAPGETIVPRGGSSSGGGGGGGPRVLRVEVAVRADGGGAHAAAIVGEMQRGSFLSDLTKAISEINLSLGIPSQQVPT
ncbi:MAG: hypothetical protein ACLP1D_10280 [Xanthobacteraceae bacterium]